MSCQGLRRGLSSSHPVIPRASSSSSQHQPMKDKRAESLIMRRSNSDLPSPSSTPSHSPEASLSIFKSYFSRVINNMCLWLSFNLSTSDILCLIPVLAEENFFVCLFTRFNSFILSIRL